MSDSLWPHELYSPWNSPGQNTRVGSLSILQGIFLTQGLNLWLLCLLDCWQILHPLSHQWGFNWSIFVFKYSQWPMILSDRIFWWKVKVKVTQSCPTLCDPMNYTVHEILQARILEWVSLFLFHGMFPNQGLNPGLPHCRWILYQPRHKGSPRILEWVAYPFSSGFSQLRNWTGVSCIVGGFFTNWAMRELPIKF